MLRPVACKLRRSRMVIMTSGRLPCVQTNVSKHDHSHILARSFARKNVKAYSITSWQDQSHEKCSRRLFTTGQVSQKYILSIMASGMPVQVAFLKTKQVDPEGSHEKAPPSPPTNPHPTTGSIEVQMLSCCEVRPAHTLS